MGTIHANEAMAEAWEHEAEGWLANADRYERAGRDQWQRFVAALEVPTDAAVLDVGCGAGSSTVDLAGRAADGSAVGIDISSRMIEHARRMAAGAGVGNVAFVHGDAQVHPFEPASFDLVVSSFGTMFFADPAAAFANLATALRPNGRLAMLVWRDLHENEWLTAIRSALALGRDLPAPPPDAPGPFSLAREARVRDVLGGAGYAEVRLEPFDEPMTFGDDPDDAFDFVRTLGIVQGLTESLDADDRERAMASLRSVVEAHATADGVRFGTAAWLVTAVSPAGA